VRVKFDLSPKLNPNVSKGQFGREQEKKQKEVNQEVDLDFSVESSSPI